MKPGLSPGMMKKARQGLGFFCLGVFLAIYAMAAIPGLHTLAHNGARDAQHECAVTLFAHGQVHCASTVVEWRQPTSVLLSSAPAPRAIFVSADIRLLPSRGPPGGFLFL
jgi:hypothetical protein